MTFKDGENNKTRIENVRQVLDENSPFIKNLRKTVLPERIRIYTFGKDCKRVKNNVIPAADAEKTDISGAINRISGDLSGLPAAGSYSFPMVMIILIQISLSVGAELKDKNIPFFAVGMGAAKSFADLEALSLSGPDEVWQKSLFDLKAVIKKRGIPSGAQRSYCARTTRFWKNAMFFFGGRDSIGLTFNLAAPSSGLKSYELEAVPVTGETVTENNKQS